MPVVVEADGDCHSSQTLLRNLPDLDGCCLSSQPALTLLVRNAKVVDKGAASEVA